VKAKLSRLCTRNMKRFLESDETDTEDQLNVACKCFTDDMFEQFRDVPPGDLDTTAEQSETQRHAEAIFKKCINQSGLN